MLTFSGSQRFITLWKEISLFLLWKNIYQQKFHEPAYKEDPHRPNYWAMSLDFSQIRLRAPDYYNASSWYWCISSHWQILRQLFTARSMHAKYFTTSPIIHLAVSKWNYFPIIPSINSIQCKCIIHLSYVSKVIWKLNPFAAVGLYTDRKIHQKKIKIQK